MGDIMARGTKNHPKMLRREFLKSSAVSVAAKGSIAAEAAQQKPAVRGDYRGFMSTATGYGAVGVKAGKPFFEPAAGKVDIRAIRCLPKARPPG
jgi:hypothetical protein